MTMGHISSANGVANQHVLELISQAVNPRNLASADTLWMAYFLKKNKIKLLYSI